MKKIAAQPYLLLMLALLSLSNSGFAASDLVPKQVAIQKAQMHAEGRVLAADLQTTKPPRYKVKILRTDGRLKVLYINAKTGALLSRRKQ